MTPDKSSRKFKNITWNISRQLVGSWLKRPPPKFFCVVDTQFIREKKYLSIATRYEGLKVDLFVTFTMLLLIVYTPKTEEPT